MPVKALHQKRGSIKAQLTNFETFLAKYVNEDPDPLKLRLRIDRIKVVFESFHDIQDEIESLEEEPNDERYRVEEKYFDLLAKAERLLGTASSSRDQAANLPVESFHGSRATNSSALTNRRIKLPEASLPTFNGRFEDWMSFKDAFKTMIDSQTDLSNVEKLQYLKSTLKGDAARKIQVFSITDGNYARAWDLLKKSYENKRILISRHLHLILTLPDQERETADGLIRLADEVQQHVLSLSSLGIDICEEILVQILEEKLHKSTVGKWDESLQGDTFPKLSEMIDFLYRTAARLFKRDDSKHTEKNSRPNPRQHQDKRGDKERKHAFMTTTTQSCPVCKDTRHPLYRCKQFRSLPVPQRIQVVKDAALCHTCLRPKHEQENCRFESCPICNQPHNTLLHVANAPSSAPSQN